MVALTRTILFWFKFNVVKQGTPVQENPLAKKPGPLFVKTWELHTNG